MREYETVFVLHPSYEDKEVEAEIQAISDIITTQGGEVLNVDRWGRRRLAYEIKRVHEGIYTLIYWRGAGNTPDDIKRRFRLNERMLRYMTVISEGPAPMPRAEGEGAPGGDEAAAEGSIPVRVPAEGVPEAAPAPGPLSNQESNPAGEADGSPRD